MGSSVARALRKPFYLDDTPSFAPALGLEPSGHERLRYFAEIAFSRLTEVHAQLGGQDNPNVLRDLERAVGAEEQGKSAAEITLDMLMDATKPRGSKRVGRPVDSYQEFAWLYADVQFLKAKTRMSERKICDLLPSKKPYRDRHGTKKASALRAKLREAKKLFQSDWKFRVVLCGAHNLGEDDSVAAAIERHALKY
jgi:hypothetical protein